MHPMQECVQRLCNKIDKIKLFANLGVRLFQDLGARLFQELDHFAEFELELKKYFF